MNRIKLLLFLLCANFFFPGNGVAQPNTNNTLLWRISGNGLKAPSYLYGTMHLNDQRLFTLGDSLYAAIAKSDGFAIEVDPQSLSILLIDELKQQVYNTKSIDKILSHEDLKRMGPALEKKLNKKVDDITTRDILYEKDRWIRDKFKTGEMQTFLDAYLFDIARRQGKWTGGVEEMNDQRNLLNEIVDKTDIEQLLYADEAAGSKGMEKMIQTYVEGDLTSIAVMSQGGDSVDYDKIVIKRNIKMAYSMDSMSRQRTMVFAVGAAHLPGQQGVIELLRKKGFKLDPVFSSKKLKPSEVKIKDKPVEWNTQTDGFGQYTIQMPGNANDLNLYGSYQMKMFIDIFNNAGYFSMSILMPITVRNQDSLLDAFAESIFESKKIRTEGRLSKDGAEGKIYSCDSDEGFRKAHILIRDKRIFVAEGFMIKTTKEGLANLDKFLGSMVILAPAVSSEGDLFHYANVEQGYQMDLPKKPEFIEEMSGVKKESGSKVKIYSSFDENVGAYYFFGTNTVLPGRYVDNDSTHLVSLFEGARSRSLNKVLRDTMFKMGSVRVLEFVASFKKSTDLLTRGRYYLKGNTCYSQVVSYSKEFPENKFDYFFNSFQLLPTQDMKWGTATTPDTLFSNWVPAPFTKLEKDSVDEDDDAGDLYDAQDSSKSNSYMVGRWHFSPYFWSVSDSVFWADRIEINRGTDSLVSKKQVRNGDLNGWEIETIGKNSMRIIRRRLLVYGNDLVVVMTANTTPEIHDENTNRFFESIKFVKKAPQSTLLDSKAAKLLSDLYSKDSATESKAKKYLYSAKFYKEDLPVLHQFLLSKDVQNDSIGSYLSFITNKIVDLHDSSSLAFAKKEYMKTPDSMTEVRSSILNIISSFPSRENFSDLADLLIASPLKDRLDSKILWHIKDTGALASQVISKFFPLFNNEYLCSSVMNICAALMDSNLLDRSLVKSYLSAAIQSSNKQLKELTSDPDLYDYFTGSNIKFLENLKDPLANQQIRKYLKIKDSYTQLLAAESLLRNGQTLEPATILSLAKDKTNRRSFYEFLVGIKKEKLFPVAYKTQPAFAESDVWTYLSDDDYSPNSITMVGQKQYKLDGRLSRFYFFKFVTDDEVKLACIGPFDLNTSKFNEPDAQIRINYEESFNLKKLPNQMNKLLKKFEKSEEDEE